MTSTKNVAWMLCARGFSLQADPKVAEGLQHEDRDAQFRYLASLVAALGPQRHDFHGELHDGLLPSDTQ